MRWFKEAAPIRQKLMVVFATMTGCIVITGVAAALLGGLYGLLATGVGAFLASILGMWYREVIAGPYVATVVRMEELAAGELDKPIQFTDFGDCVGRLTKAMFTFRGMAQAQQTNAAEQAKIVITLGQHLKMLSSGDLTRYIEDHFPPAYEELKTNFNETLDSLRTLIGSVSETATLVVTGSNEIAHASEDLARRTEGNAASLEETSAALVQIDTRLKATALSSGHTVARADQAIATVGSGRTTAEQAVQAMGRVSQSAKGIDSVIEGLDKIAFQTRVLAMNAAVEAGRAGDAGRGFAVVADLVSALAMRAEEEAKRARDQLTVTQTDIVTAVQEVEKVDGALVNISGDVDEVHKLLAAMADDAVAQSSSITQITVAISTMDQSTEQNAAMVEETSAAARNLTTEVTSLAEKAAMFKTDDGLPVHRGAAVRITPTVTTTVAKVSSVPPRSPVKRPLATVGAATAAEDWNAF